MLFPKNFGDVFSLEEVSGISWGIVAFDDAAKVAFGVSNIDGMIQHMRMPYDIYIIWGRKAITRFIHFNQRHKFLVTYERAFGNTRLEFGVLNFLDKRQSTLNHFFKRRKLHLSKERLSAS